MKVSQFLLMTAIFLNVFTAQDVRASSAARGAAHSLSSDASNVGSAANQDVAAGEKAVAKHKGMLTGIAIGAAGALALGAVGLLVYKIIKIFNKSRGSAGQKLGDIDAIQTREEALAYLKAHTPEKYWDAAKETFLDTVVALQEKPSDLSDQDIYRDVLRDTGTKVLAKRLEDLVAEAKDGNLIADKDVQDVGSLAEAFIPGYEKADLADFFEVTAQAEAFELEGQKGDGLDAPGVAETLAADLEGGASGRARPTLSRQIGEAVSYEEQATAPDAAKSVVGEGAPVAPPPPPPGRIAGKTPGGAPDAPPPPGGRAAPRRGAGSGTVDAQSDLLAQIRQGTQLRRVNREGSAGEAGTSGDGSGGTATGAADPGDLMAQIRAGATLRRVKAGEGVSPKESGSGSEGGGAGDTEALTFQQELGARLAGRRVGLTGTTAKKETEPVEFLTQIEGSRPVPKSELERIRKEGVKGKIKLSEDVDGEDDSDEWEYDAHFFKGKDGKLLALIEKEDGDLMIVEPGASGSETEIQPISFTERAKLTQNAPTIETISSDGKITPPAKSKAPAPAAAEDAGLAAEFEDMAGDGGMGVTADAGPPAAGPDFIAAQEGDAGGGGGAGGGDDADAAGGDGSAGGDGGNVLINLATDSDDSGAGDGAGAVPDSDTAGADGGAEAFGGGAGEGEEGMPVAGEF